MILAAALAPVSSKIIGTVAIIKRRKGIEWQEQSPLLQGTAIFTISFLISVLLVYTTIACATLLEDGTSGQFIPLPKPYSNLDFLPLEWLVNTVVYMYLGLSGGAMLIATVPLMFSPIILLLLLINNKQLTKRTFYILTAVSTLGWLVIACVGLVLSAG